MGRFLLRLVTRRWGWTLIGALIVTGGVLWGVSSPTIPYETDGQQQSPGGNVIVFSSVVLANGDMYLWNANQANPDYYLARASDFHYAGRKVLDSGHFDFIDRSDQLLVNVTLPGGRLVMTAHLIEQFLFYDAGHHVTAAYNATGFDPNTSGYYENRWWPTGDGVITGGLLVGALALLIRRKKRNNQQDDPTEPGWPFTSIPAYPTEPGK